MSVERRTKKSVEGRCKMSLLTGSRASFRADHYERSEVGRAEAEGLANDTGTDPARGLRQGRGSRVGSSPTDGEPRTQTWRFAAGSATCGPQEQAGSVQAGDRSAAGSRSVERGGNSARAPGARISRAGEHPARLHPAQATVAPSAGDGALRDRARRAAAKRLG